MKLKVADATVPAESSTYRLARFLLVGICRYGYRKVSMARQLVTSSITRLLRRYVSFNLLTVLLDIVVTAAVVPLPFRLGVPALFGSHPLVNPTRLGDLLCFVFICLLIVLFC